MISLLGSLLGFGSSLIGPALDAWNKSSDQKHELAMLAAQADVQSKIQNQRLEATIVESEVAEIVAAHKEHVAAAGVDLRTLAGRIGHADLTMLQKHYAAIVGTAAVEAADTIERVFK